MSHNSWLLLAATGSRIGATSQAALVYRCQKVLMHNQGLSETSSSDQGTGQ
jgi:hypothetical protein